MLSRSAAVSNGRRFGKVMARGANGEPGSIRHVMTGKSVQRVYLSFDYKQDLERVRRASRMPGLKLHTPAGLENADLWQRACLKGDTVAEAMIEAAMIDTSVTVVCIDRFTAGSKYVLYEIDRTLELGHGLIGIHISHVPDSAGRTSERGDVPIGFVSSGFKVFKYTNQDELIWRINEAAAIASV